MVSQSAALGKPAKAKVQSDMLLLRRMVVKGIRSKDKPTDGNGPEEASSPKKEIRRTKDEEPGRKLKALGEPDQHLGYSHSWDIFSTWPGAGTIQRLGSHANFGLASTGLEPSSCCRLRVVEKKKSQAYPVPCRASVAALYGYLSLMAHTHPFLPSVSAPLRTLLQFTTTPATWRLPTARLHNMGFLVLIFVFETPVPFLPDYIIYRASGRMVTSLWPPKAAFVLQATQNLETGFSGRIRHVPVSQALAYMHALRPYV
ncbi:hypothetical protein NOR_04717 [Metarhizium rileyi]|uniref:Uncharacterized protein n=1 Tax=Metarhizium rileyi (strain RCEF 4871) TaxID=1649241 RepID=A0A167DMC2_METRR|nr:hypothetical protein NOR_04717 [Metarhizium rileyi RCEF 4871]